MNKKELLVYLRESIKELLARKMPVTYDAFPANWNRLGFNNLYPTYPACIQWNGLTI